MNKTLQKLFIVACLCCTLLLSEGIKNGLTVMAASDSTANQQKIYDFLTDEMGLNGAAACGILANIERESGFNPAANGGSFYGLCQWGHSRKTRLISYCQSNGYDYTTIEGQMRYLQYELSTDGYKSILTYLKSVSNTAQGAYDAGYYWCYHYEIPGDYKTVSVNRGNLAKDKYWPVYKNGSATLKFQSCMDMPKEGSVNKGEVKVQGWAIYGKEITGYQALINGKEFPLSVYSRPDVAKVYPGYPSGKEGFTGTIPADSLHDGANTIEINALHGTDVYKVCKYTIYYSDGKVTYKYGDVNMDGFVKVSDALGVLKHVAGISLLTGPRQLSADVDGNGTVNAKDALLILRVTSGNLSTFPAQ